MLAAAKPAEVRRRVTQRSVSKEKGTGHAAAMAGLRRNFQPLKPSMGASFPGPADRGGPPAGGTYGCDQQHRGDGRKRVLHCVYPDKASDRRAGHGDADGIARKGMVDGSSADAESHRMVEWLWSCSRTMAFHHSVSRRSTA